jgi:adenylate cyclase
MMRRPSVEWLFTGALILASALWGGFLGARHMAGLDAGLDRVEYLTLDWRFHLAGARTPPRGVVIAAVDDEAVRKLGGFPLPRDVMARVVGGLAAHKPQAIAIDMVFLDPGKPEADAALANALRAVPSVVGAVGTFEEGAHASVPTARPNRDFVPVTTTVLWPIPAILGAARTGLVNMSTDRSGQPRFVPMLFHTGDRLAPSLALAAVAAALNTEPAFGEDMVRLAARTVQLDLGYHLPIGHYGPRGSFRQFSVARALDGDLNPDFIRGQIVIIGATALGTGDSFATPFDRVVPGVEVFATAISNLLAGDGLTRTAVTRAIDAGCAVMLPGLLVLLLALRRTGLGVGLSIIVFGGWAAAVHGAFVTGTWLNVAVPLAAVMPAVAAYGIFRLIIDRSAVRRLTGDNLALAKFQSPALVRHVLANPKFLEVPVRQEIPVVFLDLSGFTGVAETLGAQWSHQLLADYQARIERDVVAHGGYVTGFAGDGAMIVFGLPTVAADDASRAVRAILQMHQSIAAWLAALPPAARDRLGVRIGGHFGPVVVSRLGAAEHQHVTATGDTVNVTSRLLEIAKQQHASVIVTEDLCNAVLPADRVLVDAVAPVDVPVRGRVGTLRIRVLAGAASLATDAARGADE